MRVCMYALRTYVLVCMYVCMYECMYVNMYVRRDVAMYYGRISQMSVLTQAQAFAYIMTFPGAHQLQFI